MAGLNFNTVLGSTGEIETTYRTLKAGQSVVVIPYTSTADNTWETIYTVPVGSTLYISDIFFQREDTVDFGFGYGSTPTRVYFATKTGTGTEQVSFQSVPLAIPTGTVLKFYGSNVPATQTYITVIGFLDNG